MKTTRSVFAILLVLAGTLASLPAVAGGPYRHGYGYGPRVSIGFGFGFPYYAGYPYYRPYYAPYYYPAYYPAYYPSPVVVQQPGVYVEQNPQPAPSAQPSAPAGYWYYCADSRAYYPYVKECAVGWQRVAPQPN